MSGPLAFSYPPGRRALSLVTDAVLLVVAVGLMFTGRGDRLATVLGTAIPVVLCWGALTLHYPRAITIDARGVEFRAYGRAHRYEWSAVRAVSVRRFLVRDRVLVRITPAPPFAGRYWLLDSLVGYDDLLTVLEERARSTRALAAARLDREAQGAEG